MNRGKDLRNPKGEPTKPEAKEVPVLMFVMVEKAPGAFTLRFVCNEDVLSDIRRQVALDTFLAHHRRRDFIAPIVTLSLVFSTHAPRRWLRIVFRVHLIPHPTGSRYQSCRCGPAGESE